MITGQPPVTRRELGLYTIRTPDRRPFLPSSLALGIPSHCRHAKQPSYRSPQPAHRGLNLCAMTSPRSTYGGGYYSAPSFPDTPIYDSLVAERGTPQIAPIRVPAAYDTRQSSARAPVGASRAAGRALRSPGPDVRLPAGPAARTAAAGAGAVHPAAGRRARAATRAAAAAPAAAAPDGARHGLRGHAPRGAPSRPGPVRGSVQRPAVPRLLRHVRTRGCPCLLAGWPHAERRAALDPRPPAEGGSGASAPREAVVEPWGLAGDRRWVLIDAAGKVVTQRQQPRLALAAAEHAARRRSVAVRARPCAADRAACPSRRARPR